MTDTTRARAEAYAEDKCQECSPSWWTPQGTHNRMRDAYLAGQRQGAATQRERDIDIVKACVQNAVSVLATNMQQQLELEYAKGQRDGCRNVLEALTAQQEPDL